MSIKNVTISNIGVKMENIILGLLLLQSRTIYQLRKRINTGLNLMYSCSTGSIQAALKKLLQHGHISVSEIEENSKLKRIYTITESGKNYFNVWQIVLLIVIRLKTPNFQKSILWGLLKKKPVQSYSNNI